MAFLPWRCSNVRVGELHLFPGRFLSWTCGERGAPCCNGGVALAERAGVASEVRVHCECGAVEH